MSKFQTTSKIILPFLLYYCLLTLYSLLIYFTHNRTMSLSGGLHYYPKHQHYVAGYSVGRPQSLRLSNTSFVLEKKSNTLELYTSSQMDHNAVLSYDTYMYESDHLVTETRKCFKETSDEYTILGKLISNLLLSFTQR